MLDVFRNILLIIRVAKIRSIERSGDIKLALSRIRQVKYQGSLEAFKETYTARLMVLNRDRDAMDFVRRTEKYIEKTKYPQDYGEYCLAYCRYLEAVLTKADLTASRREAEHQPATPFVRSTLLLT
jgi:hypothetical protein